MKKIMFNDKYGLTQAVLDGRKTMARRTLKVPIKDFNSVRIALLSEENTEVNKMAIIKKYAKYQVGEEVAVAQTYKESGWNPDVLQETFVRKPTVFPDLDPISTHLGWVDLPFKYHKGWTNKMFVLADLMLHRIRITDIKVERLQDISDEDCMKEGLLAGKQEPKMYGFKLPKGTVLSFMTPREAFASLIDRISGKGTWEQNPWVYAYEFELI